MPEPNYENLEESPEERYQDWVDDAKEWVVKVLEKWKVMYVTEIKICLGTLHMLTNQTFFHWVTGDAINQLRAENMLKVPPGRPRREFGRNFYYLANEVYENIKPILSRKQSLIQDMNDSNFNKANSRHAEDLVEQMFNEMDYIIVNRDANYFRGKRCTNADLDFIVQSKVDPYRFYGVEVKNTLSYDDDDIKVGKGKWQCAKHLGLIPFFITREFPTSWNWGIIKNNGKILLYNEYIVAPENEEWAKECVELFGIKFTCWDKIPQSLRDRIALIDK